MLFRSHHTGIDIIEESRIVFRRAGRHPTVVNGTQSTQTLENGLNMIGAQVGIQRVVIGVIVVAAVLLDVVVRNGQFGKHRKK